MDSLISRNWAILFYRKNFLCMKWMSNEGGGSVRPKSEVYKTIILARPKLATFLPGKRCPAGIGAIVA
ncbi:hypothetical protein KSC_057010 [Ktedonobacter sp. SOSP1-52]|nr:hypothetical protein KSC_057010 [Ktedonobacter sp. SOSP1-52]